MFLALELIPFDRSVILRIKTLAELSFENAEERTQVSSTVAVILIHEAIEWLLRVITKDWNAKEIEGILKSYRDKFNSDQDSLDLLNRWGDQIDRLRAARNTVLHRAIVAESDVITLCSDGIELLRNFMKKIYDLDYDELTYSSLLRKESFKKLAVDAETRFN